MNKQEILDFLQETETAENSRHGDDNGIPEISRFLERFENSLPESPKERYMRLANGVLNGEFSIQLHRRRQEEYNGLLWISRPHYTLLRERNRFLRLTTSLGKLLLLGTHILGADQQKTCIHCLIELVSDQPIMKAIRESGADHLEIWMLMALVALHFEGTDVTDLIKLGKSSEMPASIIGRLSHRMSEDRCLLVNEKFIESNRSGNLNYLLWLNPKTLTLIVNPYMSKGDC